MKFEKKVNSSKLSEFFIMAKDKPHKVVRVGDAVTFELDDMELINFVNFNFDDYVETELRLDALEAQIIGEQSTFSKIREALKL